MKGLRWLLLPFAILYGLIIYIRNLAYNWQLLSSTKHSQFVISVGNIRAGGSGKTPLSIFLIDLFKSSGNHPAFISRGYGRKSKGCIEVKKDESPDVSGDEPLMVKQRFNDIPVFVSEDRNVAFEKLGRESEVVILDDAFQHRSAGRNIDLVLTDFNNLFYQDNLLPVGYLRELPISLQRAQSVIVTKCPESLSSEVRLKIQNKIRSHNSMLEVFFSTINYGDLQPVFKKSDLRSKAILLSGIAKPELFEDYCNLKFEIVEHFKFPDHHRFSTKDLEKISSRLSQEKCMLITTEKDAMRLNTRELKSILDSFPCFYLPIEVKFLEGNNFESWILEKYKAQAS